MPGGKNAKMNDNKKTDEGDKKQPFIPLAKQSKQKQKEYHTSKRGSWGELNPITRKPPNPKAYNRAKSKIVNNSKSGQKSID